jgi:serine/threonine protein kinase
MGNEPRSVVEPGRLAEVLFACLQAVEAGESPEVARARYPEYAAEIAEFLADRSGFDRLAAPLRSLAQGEEPPMVAGGTPGGSVPLPGTLGDFRILREVGRGGMGIVYEAEQISLNRRVALKVLTFAATMDPRHLQRFHNEARAAASLHHEHIVPVYAVGCERGVHYFAMQFIEGQSLAEWIARQRGVSAASQPTIAYPVRPVADTAVIAAAPTEPAPLDRAYFRRVAEWGVQAAEALEYAHQLGIVHRDIKPANLMIDGQGKLWIADFGLARTATDSGMTMSGDLVGTLRYMSPEQALAKRIVIDHRTDVYSLGATLYELLTLRSAFDGRDREELLRQIAFEEPSPPRRVNKAIAAELEIIILKAMEKNPAERYATAQELAADLRRFLDGRPIQARRPGLSQRASKWAKRHLAAVVTAAILSFLAAIGLTVSTILIWQAKDEKEAARLQAQSNYERAENTAIREAAERRRGDDNYRQAVEEITALLDRANDTQLSGDQLRQALADRATTFLPGLLAENRPDPDGQLLTGLAYMALGKAHQIRRDPQAADAHARALAIFQQLTADFPNDARFREQWDRATQQLSISVGPCQSEGDVLLANGKPTEALQAYDTVIAIDEKCSAALDPYERMRTEVIARLRRARVLWSLGQIRKVDEDCTAALPVVVQFMTDFRKNVFVPAYMTRQAELLIFRGLSRADASKIEQAAADFREAFTIIRGLTPKERKILRGADIWKTLDQAVHWLDEHKPADEELRRIRAEAAELLGLRDK